MGQTSAVQGEAYEVVSCQEERCESQCEEGGAALPELGRQHAGRKKKATLMVSRSSAGVKNPKGGLTAKGREFFQRKEGAHLKPGVKKSRREMTPQDMRRKGSWALRFYGRKGALPPLKKPDGSPTRFALTAAAWGEPVPKTVAAARKIATQGKRLLAAYERSRSSSRATAR